MKTTILNGALPGDSFVDSVAHILAEQVANGGGQVQTWTLRDEQVAYCLGCFECWTKSPGICRIDDAGRAIAASIIAGDLVVYLPKERVLVAGDLLVSPVPFTFDGYPTEWVATLKAIRQVPADVLVPGHGEVMRDHASLDLVVTLMQAVIDQVDEQLRRNTEATLDDVRKGVELTALRAQFAGDDPRRGANFDGTISGRLVAIVYYELKQR